MGVSVLQRGFGAFSAALCVVWIACMPFTTLSQHAGLPAIESGDAPASDRRIKPIALTVGCQEVGNAVTRIAGVYETPPLAERMRERAPAWGVHDLSFEGQTHRTSYSATGSYSLTAGHTQPATLTLPYNTDVAAWVPTSSGDCT